MSGPTPATTRIAADRQKRVGSRSVATGLGTDGLFEWLMCSRVRTTWCCRRTRRLAAPLDDLDEVLRVGCLMARGRFVVATLVLRARVLRDVW